MEEARRMKRVENTTRKEELVADGEYIQQKELSRLVSRNEAAA